MESYPADWYHRLPAPVKEIFTVLKRHGHISYVVGGAVRDFLLGLEPKDFDLVSDAKPDQIADYFPKTVDVGKRFGIMIVVQDGLAVEVASFRKDGEYRDGRHPEAIEFSGPEEDALRRDFTVNGLFWDPTTASVIDYVSGRQDIEARNLRAIGDADLRFGEDALRILRALRLLAQLPNFRMDPTLLGAIERRRKDLRHVSAERITMELGHIFKSAKPSLALVLMKQLGLFEQLMPELPANFPFERLDARSENIGWAFLLHFVPIEARKKFLSHFVLSREAKESAIGADSICEKLPGYSMLSLAEKKELLSDRHAALALHLSLALGIDITSAKSDFALWKSEGKLNPIALVTGKDLLALGAVPGPAISEILRSIRIAQLNEKIHTREEAIELFQKTQKSKT